ncbi:MAG: hypothetical protein WCB93_02405 [Gallionella sp.]
MDKLDTSELFRLYPRIAVKIRGLWGTRECRTLLMSLLNDSRDGKRAGFPVSVGQTIIALLNAHDEKFPQFDTKNDSLVPFTAARPRPVVVQQKQDWGFLGTFAKFIVLVCIAAVAYKYYKGS